MNFFPDEAERTALFPVSRQTAFFAHAGVTPLPKPAADAMCQYITRSSETEQEFAEVLRDVKQARKTCAAFIGAEADEIALLGPTSLGLSLFANGLPWKEGDEVLCYQGDYPANVYPWLDLRRRGVRIRSLEPERPGEITSDLVENALTERTRLVALASCHFFSGYRIDVSAIGQLLRGRGVLFSVDAIQTLGAFPLTVEHVDFLSADAHKWMLGPMAIGIVFVARRHFELLRPTLLGAWNVRSPNYIAQPEVEFVPTAQRYEPGVLNIAGVYGMKAAIDLIMAHGIDEIAARLLELKAHLLRGLDALEFEILGPREGSTASSITTFSHARADAASLFAELAENKITASLRYDASARSYLRFSPHFYNREEEIDRAVSVLKQQLARRRG